MGGHMRPETLNQHEDYHISPTLRRIFQRYISNELKGNRAKQVTYLFNKKPLTKLSQTLLMMSTDQGFYFIPFTTLMINPTESTLAKTLNVLDLVNYYA